MLGALRKGRTVVRREHGARLGIPHGGMELPSPVDRCIMGLFRETENVAVTATAAADKTGIQWSGTRPSDYRTIGNHQTDIYQHLDGAMGDRARDPDCAIGWRRTRGLTKEG